VSEVIVTKMKLGETDATGRQKPEIISGSEVKIKADMVIKALGFDPEDIPAMFSEPKLDVSKWGTIKIDLKTMQTNIEGVFAAGDIVRGASLVVWAIKDGRDAAEAIDVFLKNKALKSVKKRMVA
jgi:glutamate synthase (NADPH/NADH) small chain